MDESRYEQGMRVRREVLGDAHVDRTEARTTAFDADFQRLITETAWGSVWARPGIDRPTRGLITIAILAALGRAEELALHLRASRNTGATPEQIAEAMGLTRRTITRDWQFARAFLRTLIEQR